MTLRIVCKTTRNTNMYQRLLQALSLEIEVFGQDSSTVKENATKLIKMCNKLAVKMLKIGRFDDCMGFISDALSLTGPTYLPSMTSLRIVTLNNASSCHRRLGDMNRHCLMLKMLSSRFEGK